ncbi:MAG: HAD family hydrolase [Oscillospiraceae bacterium]|nr:HAD family hydrolase [Oscillospiraceae bacterium]
MNRTTYKIIAFDLDGTLLRDDKSIPPENLLALREAAARGIEPVVATGRIFRGIPEQLKELPFLHYYILSNGAAVYDSRADRTLFRADIPLALALSCYEYLDTLPVIYDCYQNEQGWMSRAMLERAAPYFEREPEVLKLLYGLRKPVDDLKQTLRERGEGLQKLQMFFKPEDEALRQATIRELPRRFPALVATTSVKNNIEVNSVDAGKGKALLALCRTLGVEASASVAFGDGSNDIEMLRAAGLGVAMANADEAVKAAADCVTAGNEDCGVARKIGELLEKGRDSVWKN